jgi:hypothetical protein
LIDGGANICITGDLDSLFDVVAIPPLSISVAVEGTSSIDDCCTARGLTPIQLDDGSIYWQVCYFCANAVETIISPQAIVDSSDVFQSWHQTGYRCGVSTPGCIRFDNHDGLLTMKMSLVLPPTRCRQAVTADKLPPPPSCCCTATTAAATTALAPAGTTKLPQLLRR